jgi:hypothetical protein
MIEECLATTINDMALHLAHEPDAVVIPAIKVMRTALRPIADRISHDGAGLTQVLIEEILQQRHELMLGSSLANKTLH